MTLRFKDYIALFQRREYAVFSSSIGMKQKKHFSHDRDCSSPVKVNVKYQNVVLVAGAMEKLKNVALQK